MTLIRCNCRTPITYYHGACVEPHTTKELTQTRHWVKTFRTAAAAGLVRHCRPRVIPAQERGSQCPWDGGEGRKAERARRDGGDVW